MIIIVLVCVLVLVSLAASSQIQSEKNVTYGLPASSDYPKFDQVDFSNLPDNFSFSLLWDINGTNSYNSDSGIYIKENNKDNKENCITVLKLGEDKKRIIKKILSKLNLIQYPDSYSSGNNITQPSEKLTLTIRCGREEKTVTCLGIGCNYYSGENKRLGEYINACNSIISIITSADELKTTLELKEIYE